MLLSIIVSTILFFLAIILNRFTINSVNHLHSNECRQALGDETGILDHYWLRSPGPGLGLDAHFRTVTRVWPSGIRHALSADAITVGIRPYIIILNRFTINSDNHNHYDNIDSRLAFRDETNEPGLYWLRSPGPGFDHEWAAHFRVVSDVWDDGVRRAVAATANNRGFRPSLWLY